MMKSNLPVAAPIKSNDRISAQIIEVLENHGPQSPLSILKHHLPQFSRSGVSNSLIRLFKNRTLERTQSTAKVEGRPTYVYKLASSGKTTQLSNALVLDYADTKECGLHGNKIDAETAHRRWFFFKDIADSKCQEIEGSFFVYASAPSQQPWLVYTAHPKTKTELNNLRLEEDRLKNHIKSKYPNLNSFNFDTTTSTTPTTEGSL